MLQQRSEPEKMFVNRCTDMVLAFFSFLCRSFPQTHPSFHCEKTCQILLIMQKGESPCYSKAFAFRFSMFVFVIILCRSYLISSSNQSSTIEWFKCATLQKCRLISKGSPVGLSFAFLAMQTEQYSPS